jgi:hypothetical protein
MYFVWVPNEPDPYRGTDVRKIIDPSADAATLRADLADLTYDGLVSAWHSSDHRLETESDVRRRCALVTLRGLILDELERRSTWRYRRWLRLGGPTRTRARGPADAEQGR